jgi:hypothetical protein
MKKRRRWWILAIALVLVILLVIFLAGLAGLYYFVRQAPQASAPIETQSSPLTLVNTRIYVDQDQRLYWGDGTVRRDPDTEIYSDQDLLSSKVPGYWIVVWPCDGGFCHHGKGDYLVEENEALVVKNDQHEALVRDPPELFLVRQTRMDTDPNTRASQIARDYGLR